MNKNNMNKLSEGYHIYRESKKEFDDSWNKQNPDKVCSLSIWKTVQWISGLFLLSSYGENTPASASGGMNRPNCQSSLSAISSS